MESPLVHLVYVSTATRSFGSDELTALLNHSRANNERLGITGVLLYKEGCFFQEFEGPQDAVRALYEKVARDPRHTAVTKIIHEAIPRRLFSWTMGFSDLSIDDLTHIVVSNGTQQSSLAVVPEGRTRKLLLAFCNGRWPNTRLPELARSAQ
jgi:hypothetical protein